MISPTTVNLHQQQRIFISCNINHSISRPGGSPVQVLLWVLYLPLQLTSQAGPTGFPQQCFTLAHLPSKFTHAQLHSHFTSSSLWNCVSSNINLQILDLLPGAKTITLDSIVWGVHLLQVYGETWVPPSFDASDALDAFKLFFVNKFIDYHAHELLSK